MRIEGNRRKSSGGGGNKGLRNSRGRVLSVSREETKIVWEDCCVKSLILCGKEIKRKQSVTVIA